MVYKVSNFLNIVIFIFFKQSWSPITSEPQWPFCIASYLCWMVAQSGTTQIKLRIIFQEKCNPCLSLLKQLVVFLWKFFVESVVNCRMKWSFIQYPYLWNLYQVVNLYYVVTLLFPLGDCLIQVPLCYACLL